MIRVAMASVANTVLLPMQDILGLNDEEGRMNTPGKAEGNWAWRFQAGDMQAEIQSSLKHWTRLYHR